MTDPELPFPSGPFVDHLGLRITEVAADRVVATWTAGERHHQPYGIVHGGVHASVVETLGSVGSATWFGDRGKVVGVNNSTDFYRAVKAEDGEQVVFSFIEWPDKQTRDQAWEKIMADESLKPEGEMPFAGQRMFWGGFEPIADTEKRESANAQ